MASHPESHSVLLVDDEGDIRLLWRVVLESHGGFHPITEAADGPQAFDHLDASCPDVVVTNFAMPDVSGFDVIDAVRARCPDAAIVMCSAMDVRQTAAAHGASAFLTKTESTTELLPTLAKLLAEQAATG